MKLVMFPLADLLTGPERTAAAAVQCQHSLRTPDAICVVGSLC